MVESCRKVMEAIGGYFELADYEEGVFPHKDGILLNTGRNSLEYILRSIGNVTKIYLPYYTCEVVLEPLKKLQIPWAFYHINTDFEISDDISPKVGEYVVANNYYGIKDAYIQKLAEKYGEHIIVDCAQAFFAKPILGINSFYSTRKYVGVADGGVAYIGNNKDNNIVVSDTEDTLVHDSHLLKRKQFGAEAGFSDYRANESMLDNLPIRLMSVTTKEILNHIDYDRVIDKRRVNFSYLNNALADINELSLPSIDSFVCPMVYPFLTRTGKDVRMELIKNKVFCACYWPNVMKWCKPADYEYNLSENMVCIPIDQRYCENDMRVIIDILDTLV